MKCNRNKLGERDKRKYFQAAGFFSGFGIWFSVGGVFLRKKGGCDKEEIKKEF